MIVDIMFIITLPLKIMIVINIDLFKDGIELYNSNMDHDNSFKEGKP